MKAQAGPAGSVADGSEHSGLLHNMSAPPKTVVRYEGLAGLATQSGPGGSGVCSVGLGGTAIFGTAVRFELPELLCEASPDAILRALGEDGANGNTTDASEEREPSAEDPSQRLAQMIKARAAELPLPDGCLVIAVADSHPCLWPDPLSALAVLAKCSDSIWLRAKTPSLQGAIARRRASLLVPPRFAAGLPSTGGAS